MKSASALTLEPPVSAKDGLLRRARVLRLGYLPEATVFVSTGPV
jgi:hypothetical protein